MNWLEDGMPLVVDRLVGRRLWRAGTGAGFHIGTLVPMSIWGDARWLPGVNTAICHPDVRQPKVRLPDDHPVPHEQCSCGFHAFTAVEYDPFYEQHVFPDTPGIVQGIVAGFGRVVVGPRGFKSEKAQILALVWPPWTRRKMEYAEPVSTYDRRKARWEATMAAYPVPVFRSIEEATDVFPLASVDLTSLLMTEAPP